MVIHIRLFQDVIININIQQAEGDITSSLKHLNHGYSLLYDSNGIFSRRLHCHCLFFAHLIQLKYSLQVSKKSIYHFLHACLYYID